jgi:hypothetical protein
MSVVYIVYARFSWLSFERQERYVLPTAEKMKSITEKLDVHIAKELSRIKREAEATTRWSPIVRVSIFVSSAIVVVLAVAAYLFLSVIRKTFVNLLIGWKGMALGSLSIMFDKFFQLVVQLTGAFHIPVSVVEVVLYPFRLICGLADLFNVDSFYSLLVVTCQGAKSPIKLFIDSFVLGVAILFIESKYNFLWAMSLQEMNKAFLVKYWIEGRKILSATFLVYSTAFVLSSTNPFITMLRFLLSFVNFGSFFASLLIPLILKNYGPAWAFGIPGTKWRVGLESLVGLLPVGGDVVGLHGGNGDCASVVDFVLCAEPAFARRLARIDCAD